MMGVLGIWEKPFGRGGGGTWGRIPAFCRVGEQGGCVLWLEILRGRNDDGLGYVASLLYTSLLESSDSIRK